MYERANFSFSSRELPLLCRESRTLMLSRFFSPWLGTDRPRMNLFSCSLWLYKRHCFCGLYLAYSVCSLRPYVKQTSHFCRSPGQSSPTHVNLCPSQQMPAQAACILDHLSQAVSVRLFWSTPECDYCVHNRPNEPHQRLNRTTVQLKRTKCWLMKAP